MALSAARPELHRGLVGQAARWLLIAAILGFVMLTAITALRQTFSHDDFPEDLAVKLELLPIIFPVHMFTGGLALILLPLTLALRHRPQWHRPLGRIAATDVLVAGMTAYPVALTAPVTSWSAAGFSAQATIWLALLAAGVWNIRQGRPQAHLTCMLLMTATASGAIFFRIFLALWAIFAHGRHFAVFYACDAWLAWLLPLGVTAAVLQRTGGARTTPG